MARRKPAQKPRPDAPLGPAHYDSAPGTLVSGDVWDCVEAGADVVVEPSVAGVTITESRWRDGNLVGHSFNSLRCRDVTFERCDLSGAMLDGAVLERVAFVGCRLTGTVLSGAKLTDVLVTDSRADLLNLRMAQAKHLFVEDSTLRGADLYALTAVGSAVLRCELDEANLTEANLEGTRLHGSTFARLRGALALRGCVIGPDQQVEVGIALLDALAITVT